MHVLSYRQLPVSMKYSMIASTPTRGVGGLLRVDGSIVQAQPPMAKIVIHVACSEGHSAFVNYAHALRLSFTIYLGSTVV